MKRMETSSSSSSSSSRRHLQALLWKNIILMYRNWRATLMEILLPLIFICAMVGISNQFPLTYVPPQSIPGGKITLPSLYILSARLQLSKQKLCIVPGNPSMEPYVEDLSRWLGTNYPGFNGSTLSLSTLSPNNAAGSKKWRSLQIPSLDTVLCKFSSEEALRSHIKANNYGDDGTKIYAAIVLHHGPPHWSYSLRFNYSEVADTSPPQVDTLSRASTPEYASRYAYVIPSFGDNLSEQKPDNPILALPLPGFSSLQLTIDRWIMNTTVNSALYQPDTTNLLETFFTGIAAYQPSSVIPLQNSLQALVTAATVSNANQAQAVQEYQFLQQSILNTLRAERYIPQQVDWIGFPTRGYYVSDFYGVASTVLALFLVLAYLYPVSRLIRGLVMEKETKLREGMRMMGLRNSALTGSWLITYGLIFTVIAAIATGIIKGTFYPKTDGGYLFLVFLFFGWSATTWSFCVSIFFSRAKTAATVGVVSFLALAFPYYGVAGSSVSSSGKLGSSVCAPTAFGLTIDLLSTIEANGQGITFANIHHIINGYTAANGLLWLVGDTLLYGLLGLYLDAVLPVPFREYGIPRPWNFLFTRVFWNEVITEYFPKASSNPYISSSSFSLSPLPDAKPHPLVEPLDIELSAKLNEGRGISVRQLKKQFFTPDGVKTAVDGIDLDMFEGQIFVLLGHNGAGKTTTISMLTGLIEPTDGDASVFGKRLGANLSLIQQDLGICPQHDVLWPELTVQEHLELFAAIKKIPVSQVSAAVERAIGEVGLGEKTRALAGSLSGGQKRKLSVAIALLGGSKVVFLDEPTSGMDPYSRRSTWQTLQNAREGRVIVLTTHFMDEADILGDRIAIMAEGQVRCIGSPLYLKQKFGVGYTLTCVRNIINNSATNSSSATIVPSTVILDIIKKYVPSAKLQSDVGAELSIGLPLNNQSLSSLFRELESQSSALGIASLAMSVTTIEDVFLHVCGRHRDGKLSALESPDSTVASVDHSESKEPASVKKTKRTDDDDDSSLPDVRQVDMMFSSLYHMGTMDKSSSSPSSSFFRSLRQFGIHIRALLYKRFRMMLRDKKAIFYSFLLPVCVIVGGVGLIQLAIPNEALSYQLSTAQYNTDPMGDRDTPIYPNRVPSLTYKMNAWSAASVPFSVPDIDYIYNCLPSVNVSADSPRLSATTVRGTNDPYNFISAKYNPGKSTVDDDIQSFSAWLLEDSVNYPYSVYGAYGFTWNGTIYGSDQQNGTHLWEYPPSVNISNGVVTYAVFHNTTSRHAAPVYMNLLHSALYARLKNDPCMNTGPSSSSSLPGYSITTHSFPLPFSLTQTTLLASYLSGSAATITMIALAFVPSVFSANIVSEREAGAKHQQLISGVSIPAYWISSAIFDIGSALIPALLTVAVYAIFNIQDYISTSGHRIHALVTLFVLYAGALPGSTYLLSFFFRNTSSSQNGTLMANLFAVLAMIASMIMGQALGDPSLCKADTGLRYIYRLLPGFCLGNGLYTLAFLDLQPSLNLKCAQARGDEITNINSMLEPIDAFAWKGTGTNIAFLAVEIFLYPLIAIGVDVFNSYPIIQVRLAEFGKRVRQRLCCGRYQSSTPVFSTGTTLHTKISPLVHTNGAVAEDRDVVFEARRVNNLLTAEEQSVLAKTSAKDDIVQILSLHKQYSTEKIAIHSLSFGIQPNECFGFLGVNGAGKTTTMKILTGDILPTSGTARLGGYDILTQQTEVRRLVGYCPQFDALLDLLSVKEHIELYARIKGIPENLVHQATVAAMDALGITTAANKPSHTLSGGTKRKLSVAIAMIGGPPLLFLDEPSTGMDPISRRALWKVLAAASTGHISTEHSSSGCSIVLTTHSMEEVEALCNRIGIMVNGRLQCLGNASHLRSRFGKGFDINIKLILPTDKEIYTMIDILKKKDILYCSVTDNDGIGHGANIYLREDDTKTVCQYLENKDRYTEINEKGSGWSIAATFARLSLPLRKWSLDGSNVSASVVAVSKCMKVTEFIQWWIEENLVENIQRYITKEKFPGSVLIERQGSVLRFRIRINNSESGETDSSSSSAHSLSYIFAILENIREQYSLASFAVSHASLEDVFNMFAAGSIDPAEKHVDYDSVQTPLG